MRPLFLRTALLLVLLGGLTLPAQAQQDRGTFGVRPPIVTKIERPPHGLPGAVVTNTTRQTIDVRAYPALLGQALDGTNVTQEERQDQLSAAARLMTVAPAEFTLEPGDNQRVTSRWLDVLPGAKAAYLGLVISGEVRRAPGEGGVQFNPRLVQINRLRVPGAYRSRGKLTSLRGEQAGERKLRFFVGVKNLGEVAEKPASTSFVIHDEAGEDVYRTRWPTETLILPGATVEFPVDLAEVLPAGRYDAEALMRFGRNPTLEKIRIEFELVGPNELPTPGLELGELQGGGEPGGPAEIEIPVKSIGTAPLEGRLNVELFTLAGTRPIATAKASTAPLEPGTTETVPVELGRVEVGNYRVEVVLTDPTGRRLDREIKGFPITAAEPFFDRYRGVIIALGVGLLLLALVLLLLRQRRRRRQLEAELEAARAAPAAPRAPDAPAAPAPPAARPPEAAPPPAPVSIAVDVNAATAVELQRVPGIGPAAAQRIVEYRDANGPFATFDDLVGVKGMGPQKIELLRPYLRV